MTGSINTVLIVGATGSIGRLAVAEGLRRGLAVHALVRDAGRAAGTLPAGSEIVVGDLTDAATLTAAVDGIDAVIFTHGSHGGRGEAERIDYGAVANILYAVDGRPVRIALMTAIGVTVHDGAYNRANGGHDWKRRSERLVRASGNDYTIVRPGWFDYNDADENRLVLLQGDRRRAGDSSDGVIARRAIARVLVDAVLSPTAIRMTFELVAEKGAEQADLAPVFSSLDPDPASALDGVHDLENFPLAQEPADVRRRLDLARASAVETDK